MSQISGSIHVAAPKPIDDRFRMFDTLEECKAAIPSYERYQGLEVNINGSKYWWRDGVNDNQLVPMPSGGGGSTSDDITNESGVIGATVTDALNALDSAVTGVNNTANYAAGVAEGANTAANDAANAASNAQNTANSALSVANAALPDTANFGGDVSGTYNNLTVSKIHGVDVMSGGPSDKDVLIFQSNNGKWHHQQLAVSDVSGLQTALNAKQDSLGFTPENTSNKSTSVPTDSASSTKYPTVKAVFDWVTATFTTTAAVATQITTALTGYATQAWVNSQGFITNVISALGYTPLNRAGDTLSGDISNTSTGFFRVPNGTTAQRPASPVNGMFRYNTDTARTEFYSGGAWRNPARLEGDTFTGNIFASNLSGTNTGDETNSSILSKIGYTPENAANNPVRTLDIMSAAVTTGNTTSAVTCYTFTVNQSSLRSRSKLLWDIVFQAPGTASNKILTLECNGVTILTCILANTAITLRTIPMQWFTGSQLRFTTSNSSSNNLGGVGTGSSAMNAVNPDVNGNFVFSIKIQKAVGTDTAVLESVDLSLRF